MELRTDAAQKSLGQSIPDKTDSATLNVFQRLIRQWDTLHPYNVVQMVKVRGSLDIEALRIAWHDAMQSLGLGLVAVRGHSYHFSCLNGQAIYHNVRLCPANTNLEDWIADELNRPFDATETVPFRPFALAAEDHFWMGFSYQHWVTDNAGVRLVMREWFVRMFDPTEAGQRPVRLRSARYLSLFNPLRSGWHAGEALLSSLRWQCQLRRVRRIENPRDFARLSVRCHIMHPPDGLIDGICRAARAKKVTVNDIFMAALAEACDKYVPAERRYHRRDLAVGTIVDLRSKSDRTLEEVFSPLLGFASVSCRPSVLANWDKLLGAIAFQTRRQKRTGVPQYSWLRMLAGLAAGKMLSREEILTFYRKRVSLAGACTNVNLNRSWALRYHPNPLLEYVRAAPTGPITPLVIAATTLGHRLSLTLTYRTAILPEDRAAALAATIMDRLEQVAGSFV
jgi:hypothetical protein